MVWRVFPLLLVLFLFACATPTPGPAPPEHTNSTPSESPLPPPEPPRAEAGKPEPPVERMAATPASLAAGARTFLPGGCDVSLFDDRPILVRDDSTGEDRVIGLAADPTQLYVWTAAVGADGSLREGRFESVGPAREIRSFVPLHVTDRGPDGFTVTLVRQEVEEFLVAIAGTGRPYVVVAQQSTGIHTEIRDVDGDGSLELLQYSLMHEAPANREIVLDLFEWQHGSFTFRSSVPLLRTVNAYLAELETALRDENDDVLIAVMERASVAEGPPLEEMLPADEVTVPRLQELPVEISLPPWDFTYEFRLRRGNTIGLYRLSLRLSNTFHDRPAVLIRGERD